MCVGSCGAGGKLEATGQLGGGHVRRQLEQGERVASGLGDDPVSDVAVEPAGDDARQQRAGILLGQPVETELGQTVEVVLGGRLAHRDHDRHRLGPHSSRDEAEDLGRGGIQPLRVLDETEQRPLRPPPRTTG